MRRFAVILQLLLLLPVAAACGGDDAPISPDGGGADAGFDAGLDGGPAGPCFDVVAVGDLTGGGTGVVRLRSGQAEQVIVAALDGPAQVFADPAGDRVGYFSGTRLVHSPGHGADDVVELIRPAPILAVCLRADVLQVVEGTGPQGELTRLTAAGADPRTVTSYAYGCSLSDDGQLGVYASDFVAPDPGVDPLLFRWRATPGESEATLVGAGPVLSPDGRTAAYVHGTGTGHGTLWTADFSLERPTESEASADIVRDLQWSPDGAVLATRRLGGDAPAATDVLELRGDGTAAARALTTTEAFTAYAWSAGSDVLVIAGPDGLTRIDVATGELTPIATGRAFTSVIALACEE